MIGNYGLGISHLISVLIGLIPLLIYVLTNQKRKIGYAVIRNFEIVTFNDHSMADQVSLVVNGQVKKDVRTLKIILQNIGMKDIENQSIDIRFSPEAKIINAQSGGEPPSFISAMKMQGKNGLQFEVPLMNSCDRLEITCLTENDKSGTCIVSARGLNLTCQRFDPSQFISPTVNTIANMVAALLIVWLVGFCFIT